ncbi:hypothetical protein Tco_1418573 [Tanacetum coccineum]
MRRGEEKVEKEREEEWGSAKDPKGNIQPASVGFPSTPLDEGISKSKPLPEGKTTYPKNSEGNKQPINMGLPSTVPDEGISKTKPLQEGANFKDKESERFKPLADMESSTPTVDALLRTDVEYQVDQTQSTRFEDELQEDSESDIFETREEIAEHIQEPNTEETQNHHSTKHTTEEPLSTKHQSPSPTKDEKHEEATASYANLKHEIGGFHDATFKANENTDTALRNYQQILIKDDPALNKKGLEPTEAYTKNFMNLTKLLTLVKTFDFSSLKFIVESLKAVMDAQNDHLAKWAKSSTNLAWSVGLRLTKIEHTRAFMQADISSLKKDTSNIKNMMTKIFYAFKGQSTPSSSMPKTTLAITKDDMVTEEAVEKEPTKEPKVENVEKKPEILIPQPTGPVIDITLPEQPESPPAAPKANRGKGKVIDAVESPPKLVKASSKIEQAAKEAKLSKPELIKDAEIKFHNREHFEKIKRLRELRKKRIEKYTWTTSSRLKLETIIDVKIHPNTKPVAMTVFRGTNKRNFDVHNPFNFGAFGVTEWDELREIIPRKKNKELKPQICIPGLEYDIRLPEGIPFVNNMMIEQSEYGMFFIYVFGDEAFQRIDEIHKVDVETLLTYLVMASNISTPANQKFCL